MDIMTFQVRDGDYSHDDFIEVLLNTELEEYHTLKVSCFLTEFNNWDEGETSLRDIFKKYNSIIQDLGAIKRAIFPFFDEETHEKYNVIFYFYLDPDKKILFSYTDEKIDIIRSIFGKIVNRENNIYSMFISSSCFNYLIRNIKKIDETSECIYFSAKHLASYITKGKYRPEKSRTIVYHAIDGDGIDALNEMKTLYGVLPTIMRFRLMDVGTYEIHNVGLFRISSEYVQDISRLKLFEIMELIIEYILKQKKILVDAKYKLIPIETKYKKLNIPSIKPLLIEFNDDIQDEKTDDVIDIFNNNDYPLYNYVKESGGSFRISGMVADGRKNSLFSVYINNKQAIISPIDNCNFDTFMRLYEVIVENIAPEADIKEVDINE